MTLSDRIAVMDRGRVMQVGTPAEIYEYPANRFVAGFIGQITTFAATVAQTLDGTAILDTPDLGPVTVTARAPVAVGQALTLALRPEKIAITRDRPAGPNAVQGQVRDLAYFGKDSLYRVTLPSGALVSVHAVNARRGAGAHAADWDDRVWLSFDPDAAILLTGDVP